MKPEDSKQIYERLFSNAQDKAEAFDKLAEKYYYSNFGTASKADIDALMFSIYLEKIMDREPEDFAAYSDYTLSKQLGITQSRISNLKVKKELLYPYDKFEWKNTLLSASKNAIVENGRIKFFIPDRNVYLEVRNAVESRGGFIDVTLSRNLLVIRTEYFLDLLLAISDDSERKRIYNDINEILKKNTGVGISGKEPIGKRLMNQAPKLVLELIGECVPFFGGAIKCIGENMLEAIRGDNG